jgi:asparagine synthase (glutamine-hydrolysing)
MASVGQSSHQITPDGQVLIRGVYSPAPLYFFNKPIKTASGQKWLVSRSLRELGTIVNNRPDPAGLRDYLVYGFVPAPRTIFEGISAVPPGMICNLPFTDDQPRWSYCPHTDSNPLPQSTETVFLEQLCILSRRYDSTVLLSGGLASALIAVAASSSGALVNACHARFSGFDVNLGSYTHSARYIAKTLKLNYQERVISAWDVLRHFGNTVTNIDQPLAMPFLLALRLMLDTVPRQATVLTGQGGSQLLGAGMIKPVMLREAYPESHYSRELAVLAGFNRFADDAVPIMSTALSQKLDSTTQSEFPIKQALANAPSQNFCDQLRWTDLETSVMQLALPGIEACASPYSLKVSHPFLHEQMIAMAFALPEKLKLSGVEEKILLKRLTNALLPQTQICQKKPDIANSLDFWFKHGLLQLSAKWLNKSSLQKSGLLNPEYVQEIRRQCGKTDSYPGDLLWQLCVLECWFAGLADR